MVPELTLIAESLRASLTARLRENEQQITHLQAQIDALRIMLDPEKLELLAQQLAQQIHSPGPANLDPVLLQFFRGKKGAVRWTDALQHLVQRGIPCTASQVIDTLKSSPQHFVESGQGWWKLASDPSRTACEIGSATVSASHHADRRMFPIALGSGKPNLTHPASET